MDKTYTCEDLPMKNDGSLNNVQYRLTDETILDYLNRIVKDSNKLTCIEYKEVSEDDKIGMIHITFKMVKENSYVK